MHSLLLTSIVPLFLLAGVALPGYIPYHMDTAALQPIVTTSQERRICAELCMTGLGGTPCGDDCVDFTPQGLPLQSLNGSTTVKFGVATRHEACIVLCENQLGEPLCHCNETTTGKVAKKPDFMQVCGFFCVRYDYRIYGCQTCSLYKNATEARMLSYVGVSTNSEDDDDGGEGEPVVNWDLWCQNMCQEGNGGAACNCDLLPMSLEI
uniref:Uncharacterized protein n=1 Tax=Anoplophora glabripennis TaxID=217634 RepID=V5GRN7_ANOGL